MIKFEKRHSALLAGCLGSLVLTGACLLLPWVSLYRILHYPDSGHARAHLPEVQKAPRPDCLGPALDVQSKAKDFPLLPPSLKRVQDLEGSVASSQIMQKIEALIDAQINVAGVVIDESGTALPEVDMTWSLGYVSSDQKNSGSVKTNPSGEFLITGVISPTIHLTPYKAGYTVRSESTGTWFADVPCSKEAPLELFMTKD